MRDWITTDLVLGALLVTSFACVGVLSLWAATSRRHWFLRAAVLLGTLAIPLVVPAYEPLLLFTVQACIVVAGVKLWQRRRLRELRTYVLNDTAELRIPSTFRFSLATLMLVMVLVAIAAAPVARAAEYFYHITYAAPLSMLVDGAAAGIVVLLVAWVLASERKRVACAISLGVVILLAVAVPSVDWLHMSVTSEGYWPPVPANYPRAPRGVSTATALYLRAGIFWLGVFASLAAVCMLLIGTFHASPRILIRTRLRKTRGQTLTSIRLTTIATSGCLLLLAVLPGYVLWLVLHPLPVPKHKAPDPNGIDEIFAASQTFSKSPIFNFLSRGWVQETSTDALAKEIELYSAAFTQLQEGMRKDVQVVMFSEDGDLKTAFDRLLRLRQPAAAAANALRSKAELACRQERYGAAADHSLEAMRLASLISQDADELILIFSTGVMEGIAAEKLYAASAHLSAGECRSTIVQLIALDKQRESLADAEFRTRIRTDNIDGWAGKFISVVADFTNANPAQRELEERQLQRASAINRLLTLQLALRAHQLANGAYPDRIEQLVPQILQRAPVDPFDPDGRPLRYVRTDDGYLAYSVGADGDDDGGRPLDKSAPGWNAQFGDGDLRLDAHFEPRPAPAEKPVEKTPDTPPASGDN